MATCALVNLTTNQVENLIIAEASDPIPVGYLVVTRPPDWVQIGTDWRDGTFVRPPEPPASTAGRADIKGVETV